MATAQPPTGYYKQLLPPQFSHVNLAFTNQPMSGVTVLPPEVGQALTAHFDGLTDQHAAYYAAGLRSGAIVAVSLIERYYKPGELFFTS